MRDGSKDIGLFPLRLFLLPGEQTTLHIYEPRYLQLVSECLLQFKDFGIPYQTKTSLSEFGSMVKVVEVVKAYDSGELDILVECNQNFRINHFEGKSPDKMYPCGSIAPIALNENLPSKEMMTTMKGYLETLLDKTVEEELSEYYSFGRIIKSMNLNDEEKFKFLGYSHKSKNNYLIGKAKFLTLLVEQEKKVVDQFYLN